MAAAIIPGDRSLGSVIQFLLAILKTKEVKQCAPMRSSGEMPLSQPVHATVIQTSDPRNHLR